MKTNEHFDKDNLHHAYLLEGARDEIVPEILEFCESLNIKTLGNPDFYHVSVDNFKIDDAFNLREMSIDKSFSSGKKIFVIYINSITLDAQNVLLKMFEEPKANTHFFLITLDANIFLKTLVSRFYLISTKQSHDSTQATKNAEKFISLPLQKRINFIKNLLTETKSKNKKDEVSVLESTRFKALNFLNALEFVLHKNFLDKKSSDTNFFHHFFKVREFLRIPGSSIKSLMESIALLVP